MNYLSTLNEKQLEAVTTTEVLAKWQDRLNYIQVDEFQDSSGTEMHACVFVYQKNTQEALH